MRFKRTTAMFMAFLLVLPTFPAAADEHESSSEYKNSEKKGSYTAKHEVVYATLNAAGDQEEMYVVNNFNIKDPGKIVDHGPYTSVQNLTDLTDIEQKDHRIELTAEEDEFYYQGNLEGKPLPWDINVSYQLNGKTMSPEELLGKDGELQIQIDTAKNIEADSAFFNNYLLQITLQLDSKIYENIEAPDGTVANAGKNRQVTFTVMPEKEGSFTVSADVTDLEMESIEIAAVPPNMSIGAPDVGGMKSDMNSLSDSTAEINRGVGKLQNRIAELNDGVARLYDGSKHYKNGINELNNRSSQLVEGSASIKSTLQQMSDAVNNGSGNFNLNELTKMEGGIRQLADGLKEAEAGLENLKNQYSDVHQKLSQAIEQIPAYDITEEDIQALYDSGADKEVVDQLVETYHAAQKTKDIHANVNETFNAVDAKLEESAGSLHEMSSNLTTVADQVGNNLDNFDVGQSIKELQQGLQALSSNYNQFHSGLTEYTGGVDRLADSYEDIHGGIAELTNGTEELEKGASELHKGTSELASSTSDLPGQMQSEVDKMIDEYDKSDFEPVSFVSSDNKKVESVQFVIKTESIKREEEEQEAEKKKEKNFWDRLLDLFR